MKTLLDQEIEKKVRQRQKANWHMLLMLPALVFLSLFAGRMLWEIWVNLAELPGERLTGYCALLAVAVIAWTIVANMVLEMLYDR